MKSKASLFGHPIHQMLIVFPLGLLATAVIFDAVYLITGDGLWFGLSYWLIISGIVGGLIAAPFGLIDWLAIKQGTRAKNIGLIHGLGNVVVLALFFLSWLQRDTVLPPTTLAFVLSFSGGAISLITGWLGGELINRFGIGVHENANLNAHSSLSGQPTHRF